MYYLHRQLEEFYFTHVRSSFYRKQASGNPGQWGES